MVRNLKIIFAVIFAVWGLFGGSMNLAGYGGGLSSVESVTSMSHKDPEARAPWTTSNPIVIHLAFALIWGAKLLGGILCAIGARNMWRTRNGSAGEFNAAKGHAVAGLGVYLIMLIGGFNLFGAVIYGLWAGPAAVAFDLSWVFAGEIGLIMIFMNMRDDEVPV